MPKYTVNHNFEYNGKSYDAGTEVEMAAAIVEEIEAKGKVSHPALSPFLTKLNDKKMAVEA